MMIGGAFAAWLGDRPARARSMTNRKGVADAFRALPEVARLEAELAALEGAGAEPILAAARRFLETRGMAERAIGLFVGAALQDRFYRPHTPLAGSPVLSGLLLFERPELTVQVAVLDADAIAAKRAERTGGASIVFSGERSLFRVIDGGGATLSFWEAPPIRPGFTAAASGRCRFVERRPIEDGETFELDGASQAFIVERAARNLVYLQASTPLAAAALRVEYDSATLAFIGASSTDEASSRMQMMLALLRILDRRDSVPVFRDMLASEHFYTRWQTMRELLALDAEAALPHLRAMASGDPHPEVREAAAGTLDLFFTEAAEAAEPCPA
jgi:HEAT repeats